MTKSTPKRKSPQRFIPVSPAAADTLMRLATKCDYGTRIALVDAMTKKLATKHDEPFQPDAKPRTRA